MPTRRPTPLTDRFISNLKAKLGHLNITQVKLASDIGVRKQKICEWFSRKSNPSSEYVLKIQGFLKRYKGDGAFSTLIVIILAGCLTAIFLWAFFTLDYSGHSDLPAHVPLQLFE